MKPALRRAGWVIGALATLASVAYIIHSWRGQDLSAFFRTWLWDQSRPQAFG